ncbi:MULTISPECIES: aromatic amino acid hydroxylase [unclassified Exiguobacterium]|uniref:aromatic amino acid hydroxylase n=1 Tax=unclassified Exiguobacterium TaxID=2644629 RepID=UPI001039FF10|nr:MULTISPECIES: aromatic amino acid hydroxylase [unclassified Exiguobacterium]TCI44337.1 aromatic amino acid hydroxylase [Exiguobacterium sp. SH5S32]TCI50601.1 aromatic amino acid hydroxylase [Exiguobacterium sp. SH1S4]TCI69561.1 aromatic amino acid hydroxylase [Exiguobacterium sp. SH1S1]
MLTQSIPRHLAPHISPQFYNEYTPTDHAVWRFVLRLNLHTLEGKAHPFYIEGLKKTGMGPERLPDVEKMTTEMRAAGWSTVAVDGLIPGVAFFDFQGNGMLPVATDIRKVENILYSPAPDIIHEAAGHAPMLMDPEFSKIVKRFGQLGAKAFMNREEHASFAALKRLTIVKENANSTEADVKAALEALHEAKAQVTGFSEAQQVARIFWWTVEFGLIGDIERPLIYGAGLLSSVGESRHCLTDAVTKHPFNLEHALETKQDVTNMQSELFVIPDFEALTDALDELESRMAVHTGGIASLEKALASGSQSTIRLEDGTDRVGTVRHVTNTGRVALVQWGDCVKVDHGQLRNLSNHGLLVLDGPIQEALAEADVRLDGRIVSETTDEITLEDVSVHIDGKQIELATLEVRHDSLPSIFPGTDVEELVVLEKPVQIERDARTWTEDDPLFNRIRLMREQGESIDALVPTVLSEHADAWLAQIECLELVQSDELRQALIDRLQALRKTSDSRNELIARAMDLLK